MAKNRRKKPVCPNCGWKIEGAGNFCSNCGQENHDLNVPLKHLFLDIIENTFHFDSKVFRSIRIILTRPGGITKKFIEGMRSNYVSPARLYVFITAIYFVVFAYNRHHSETEQVQINSIWIEGLKKDGFHSKVGTTQYNFTYEEIALLEHSPVEKTDSILKSKNIRTTWYQRILVQKIASFALNPNSGQLISEIAYKNLSFIMFLLMPLFALLLRLVYSRKKFLYFHHFIFALHYHSVLFFFLLLSELSVMFFSYSFINIAWWAVVLYLLVSIHNVYGDGWVRSFFKFFFVSVFYLFFTGISIVLSTLIRYFIL